MTISMPQFSGRVLLVEDNPINVLVAQTMLREMGVDVDVASDGHDAIAKLGDAAYDLVLMDCQMPQLDGYAAARAWRAREASEQRPRTPIVALTANALPSDRQRSLDAGMDDHVSKPYRSNQLTALLERYLTAV